MCIKYLYLSFRRPCIYINEPDITGMFYGLGTIDLPNGERQLEKNYDEDNASWYAKQAPDHVRVYVPLDSVESMVLK